MVLTFRVVFKELLPLNAVAFHLVKGYKLNLGGKGATRRWNPHMRSWQLLVYFLICGGQGGLPRRSHCNVLFFMHAVRERRNVAGRK